MMQIRDDHRLHALYSGGLTLVLGPMAWAFGVPVWIAVLAVLAIGAGRELAQWRSWLVGQAEWSDMAANVAGIAVACVVLYGMGIR